jgi:Ion channel
MIRQRNQRVISPPRHLRELQHIEARRAVLQALLRALLTAVALLVVYYHLPIVASTDAGRVVRILLGSAIIVAVVALEIRAIYRSELPQARAIISLTVSVTVMIVAFATFYVNLSDHDPGAFSEQLGRTGSLYFTMTTLSTVGYGDISARTNPARVAVMVQMVFNVAVLGVAVRLIAGTAKSRLSSGPRNDG